MDMLQLLLNRHNNQAVLSVEEVGAEYWRYAPAHARKLAMRQRFPIPAFRTSASRKAPMLVRITDLAEHLEACANRARSAYRQTARGPGGQTR